MTKNPKKASLPPHLAKILSDGCKDCILSEKSYPISPRGNFEAKVMLIGEGPGKEEERDDCFFVGPAGRELQSCIEEVGLLLDEHFFIHNAVLCRPHPPAGTKKENRAPTRDEILSCRHHLESFVEAHNPDLLVTIGGVAAQALMEKYPGSVGKTVGKFYDSSEHNLNIEADLFAIYHPAFILRNPGDRDKLLSQLIQLRDYMIGRDLVT